MQNPVYVQAALVAVGDELLIDNVPVRVQTIARSSTGRVILTLANGAEASIPANRTLVQA